MWEFDFDCSARDDCQLIASLKLHGKCLLRTHSSLMHNSDAGGRDMSCVLRRTGGKYWSYLNDPSWVECRTLIKHFYAMLLIKVISIHVAII